MAGYLIIWGVINMAKIKLTKPLNVAGKDVTEVEINPEKLSGNDLSLIHI